MHNSKAAAPPFETDGLARYTPPLSRGSVGALRANTGSTPAEQGKENGENERSEHLHLHQCSHDSAVATCSGTDRM